MDIVSTLGLIVTVSAQSHVQLLRITKVEAPSVGFSADCFSEDLA